MNPTKTALGAMLVAQGFLGMLLVAIPAAAQEPITVHVEPPGTTLDVGVCVDGLVRIGDCDGGTCVNVDSFCDGGVCVVNAVRSTCDDGICVLNVQDSICRNGAVCVVNVVSATCTEGAICVVNGLSAVCRTGATCVVNINDVFCQQGGLCGANVGFATGPPRDTANCDASFQCSFDVVVTCYGAVCGANVGGDCSGGVCGVNLGAPPSFPAACQGGICVVNAIDSTCLPDDLCVVKLSGVCRP